MNVEDRRVNYVFALTVLAAVFFMWGFATVLNDILVPHLKAVFQLNYGQSLLIQFVFYLAYLLMSLPAAKLLERIGYKRSIVAGLAGMAGSALCFVPAAGLASYGLFLGALFLLASAITLLQVAANPYVALIGPAATASSRLNLVQALNSAGTTVAPIFGGMLILARSSGGTVPGNVLLTPEQRLVDAQAVQLPYVLVSLVLIALAVLVWRAMSHADAAQYLSLFWGGAMVGRFAGAFAMRRLSAESMLTLVSVGALVLTLIAILGSGKVAMWCLIAVGLCHSVMFPTIFTLGIRGLGPLTEEGSGLLIMAIAGGALAALQGVIADHIGLQLSYLLPATCYIYVLFYAALGCRVSEVLPNEELSDART